MRKRAGVWKSLPLPLLPMPSSCLLGFLLAGLLPLQQAAELNCLNESERVLAARLTGHRTPDRTGQYAHGISNDKNSWTIPRASRPKTSGASLPA